MASAFNSLNKVMIMGSLGKDPDLRHTKTGIPVTTLLVATSESYKNQDGSVTDKTTWHNIVTFRNMAESCSNYLRKGSLVFVEGKLQTRNYQDKDGNTRYVTEIIAETVKFLDRKGQENEKNYEPGGYNQQPRPQQNNYQKQNYSQQGSYNSQPSQNEPFVPDFDDGDDELPF